MFSHDVATKGRDPSLRSASTTRWLLAGGALLLGGPLAVGKTEATVRYVDSVKGTDTADCDNPLDPCQNIRHTIDESLPGDTIKLISLIGAPTVFSEAGLKIVFDLTISGEGALRTEIDAKQFDRLFVIDDGASAIIEGVTLRNGLVPNGLTTNQGGAILVRDGDLRLSKSRLLDNQASVGGGIAARAAAGNVDVVGSHIAGNLGTAGGGGIWCDGCGGVSIVDSEISDNVAGGSGGAIRALGTTVSVRRSHLMRNNADEGGAVHATAAALTITESELSDNEADSADGGGIFIGGTLNLERSTLAGNTALFGNGGAVHVGANSLVFGSNSTFSGNTAAAGGALSLPSNFGSGSVATIVTSTFYGNEATVPGLAEHISGDWNFFSLHNSIITASPLAGGVPGPFCNAALNFGQHNRIDDNSCDSGGATFNLGAVTDLDPLLAANSGLGRTHLPAVTSNAVDAGLNNACFNPATGFPLIFDQRGKLRPVDFDSNGVEECDIGAVELQ